MPSHPADLSASVSGVRGCKIPPEPEMTDFSGTLYGLRESFLSFLPVAVLNNV
jgi:hypothetical protein